MIVDFFLDIVEGLVATVIGWMPRICHSDSAMECAAYMPNLGNVQGAGVVSFMIDLFSFTNYFLPVQEGFMLLGVLMGVLAAMATARLIWRLLPFGVG